MYEMFTSHVPPYTIIIIMTIIIGNTLLLFKYIINK